MSHTALKSVNHSIFQLIKQYQVGMSYEKRYGMTGRLTTMMKELHGLGYIVRHIGGIKPKHVQALVDHWKDKHLSVGTMKNRLSDVRFVCDVLGKASVIQRNTDYQIGSRTYVATENKAILNPDFSAIQNDHLSASLELQRVFGLRREECLKIKPSLADRGDQLWLKGSWTKGNVERLIPIRTPAQREALNRAKALVGKGQSLIPSTQSYIQQRHVYDRETRKAGYFHLHGLRHAYAQSRYQDLTGWKAPIQGGPPRKTQSTEARYIDRAARQRIANELGHSRVAITKIYLG